MTGLMENRKRTTCIYYNLEFPNKNSIIPQTSVFKACLLNTGITNDIFDTLMYNFVYILILLVMQIHMQV